MVDESARKQIEEHRAIPRAGWTFAAGMSVALLALLPLFTTLAILMGWLSASLSDLPTRIVLGLGAFEGLGIAWLAFFAPANQWPKVWLRAYWRKNARGYVAWRFVVAEDGTGGQGFHICSRGNHITHPMHTLSIGIPLGGWFAKPQVLWRREPSRWRVLPRHDTDSHDWVRLRDSQGAVMVMPIGDALWILGERLARAANEPFWQDTTDVPFTWLDLLTSTREERDDAKRDWDATRKRLEEANRALAATIRERDANARLQESYHARVSECEVALREAQQYRAKAACAESQLELTRNLYDETLAFLEGLVEQCEKFVRCRTHLESLRILHQLLHFLPSRFDDSSEKFMRYSDARAAVSGQIHDLERRDRKRHGRKRPKAAAPAETTP